MCSLKNLHISHSYYIAEFPIHQCDHGKMHMYECINVNVGILVTAGNVRCDSNNLKAGNSFCEILISVSGNYYSNSLPMLES